MPAPALSPAAWKLVLGAWLAVGVAVGVRTWHRPASHTVFPKLALGAEHWWADRPLYDEYPPLDYFRYPPALAVAVTPLAALGLTAGGVVWAWLGLAVYGLGLARFQRDVLPGDWTSARRAAFLLLALFGALRGLWNGQSNALVAGLVLLAGSAVVRRRWWAAAALLAVAVHVKLTPLVLAGLLCALYPRHLTPRLMVAVAALGVAVFLTRPPDAAARQHLGYADHLLSTASERWPSFRDGWTVWLVLRHRADGAPVDVRAPLDAPAYRLTQALAGLAVLAWCLRRRGGGDAAAVNGALGLGMAWLLLFGPAAEHATFVFLAPWLAWAVVQRGLWPAGRPLADAAAVLVLLLGWGALTEPFAGAFPWALTALPLGAALCAAWLVGVAPQAALSARTLPSRSSP
jgi:hypothetical protein